MTPQEQATVLEAREILGRYLSQKPILGSWDALLDYCKVAVRGENEEFHVLYLDTQNRLIEDRLMATGTVNHVPVYPREVVRQALLLNATAMIIVHNHPSGGTKPSAADIKMTKEIIKACKVLDLTLHDHIITGGDETSSLRALGKI